MGECTMDNRMPNYQEQIKDFSNEELIDKILRDKHLKRPEQGIIIIELMNRKGLIRHGDVAEIIGLSRSWVSLRIAAAKAKYQISDTSEGVGRKKHAVIEVDDLTGRMDIPLRITVKVGDLPKKEVIRLLKEAAKLMEKLKEEDIYVRDDDEKDS